MEVYDKDVEHRSDETPRLALVPHGCRAVLRDNFVGVMKLLNDAAPGHRLFERRGVLSSRAIDTQHDFDGRLALGVSALTLVRRLLAEGLILSALGCADDVISRSP